MSAPEMLTSDGELLLRAALAAGPPADAAYRRWRAGRDLNDLDHAAHRVLPLLAERLEGAPDDPIATQVHRVVRFTWLRTQQLMSAALPAIAALRAAGIPVMLGKGAAVLAHTGWHVQMRPMDDFDLIVPRTQAAQAVAAVRAAGFDTRILPPGYGEGRIYDEHHALGFRDSRGAEIDIHWHALHTSLHRDSDHEFWARRAVTAIRDEPVDTLCREDAFVQVVAHGFERTANHALLWASDATLLVRCADGTFDWALVAETARRHRLEPAMRHAVAVLRRVSPVDVPDALPPRLRPRGRRLGAVAPRVVHRRAAARDAAREYVGRTVPPGERLRLRDGAGFVREAWGLETNRELPRHAGWVFSGRRLGGPPRTVRAGPALAGGPPWELEVLLGDPGADILGPGWWSPDAVHGCWSRGREAALAVALPVAAAGDLVFDLSVVPFLAPNACQLDVRVFDGAAPAAAWEFRGSELTLVHREVAVAVPAGGRTVALRFVLSRRGSPHTAGMLADRRPLGILARRLTIRRAG